MKRQHTQEDGFVLVFVLMLMVVLMLLGVSGIGTSIFESKMTGNNALHKQTFYEADGGTEVGISLIGQNMNCQDQGGFDASSGINTIGAGQVKFHDSRSNFYVTNNELQDPGLSDPTMVLADYTGTIPETTPDFIYNTEHGINYLRINSRNEMIKGNAFQASAGYEGRGRGSGTDGAYLVFGINSLHLGARNSETGVCLGYVPDNQFSSNPYDDCVY